MRRMEPCLLHMMTDEAQSTTDFIRAIYGEDYKAVEKARVQVHEALTCLEQDGLIESRICYAGPGQPSSRYWALPGGTFPPGVDTPPLTERIASCLADGPKDLNAIYNAVYTADDTADSTNAYKRLSKALNRMRQRGQVVRTDARPPTWRLSE